MIAQSQLLQGGPFVNFVNENLPLRSSRTGKTTNIYPVPEKMYIRDMTLPEREVSQNVHVDHQIPSRTASNDRGFPQIPWDGPMDVTSAWDFE